MREKKHTAGVIRRYFIRNYEFLIMLLPAAVFFAIFHFASIYGIQIAFKDYNPAEGLFGGDWVGFKHLKAFLGAYNFGGLLKNTLSITVYTLLLGTPLTIIFALLINELNNKRFRGFVQTVTFVPHFVSVVVMAGIVLNFLSPDHGIINTLIKTMGGEPVNFITIPSYFKHIYVWGDVWQNTGYNAIIYLAALSAIDPTLYEAAEIDGASRIKRMIHINIPCIMPTIVTMLILNMGSVMNLGYEKILLYQNDLNIEASEVISTYVYRRGILGSQYSFSTAVNLFNSVINLILVASANLISNKAGQGGLF